jgi:hypothetical protein
MNPEFNSPDDLKPYLGQYIEAEVKGGTKKGKLAEIGPRKGQFTLEQSFGSGAARFEIVAFSSVSSFRVPDKEQK